MPEGPPHPPETQGRRRCYPSDHMRNAARREARGWPEAYTLRGIPPLRAQDLPFLLFARCVPSGKADSARIINVLCMSSYSPCAPTQCSNPVVWFRLLREDNLSNLPLSLLLRRPITCSPLHIHTTGVRVCDHKFTDCTRRMRWGKASEPPR